MARTFNVRGYLPHDWRRMTARERQNIVRRLRRLTQQGSNRNNNRRTSSCPY